jgi:TolB-like protein/DNA-binding winged helix-turn-helix (wHTH) protein
LVSGAIRIQGTICFGGEFELDLQAYELRRAGRALKLERIPMQVLAFLLEHRNELVTREQIVERVWGKDAFFDTDNSINGAIRKIRQVLRDHPEHPRFIQTITGQGYRFVAPVTSVDLPSEPTSDAAQPSTGQTSVAGVTSEISGQVREGDTAPQSRAASSNRSTVYATLLCVVLFGLAVWLFWLHSRAAQPRSGRMMLAVLPFQNLTGDPGQEYFSDGLTEEMITQLGNLDTRRLGVIARTSVMHYKNTQSSLQQIGRELGVEYVIEGSVRRDANNIRIAAQLIQTKDQTHVWARQYDRELKGVLALQSEIAQDIANEIEITVDDHNLPAPSVIAPREYDAYDLYLKGQYFLNKRNATAIDQASEYFRQATVKDPDYARAYAGLADSYALMGGYTDGPQTEFMPKARAAALRALQIDPSLPEAHTALALIVQNYDWDWERSEKEFRRAIELNPNYATAHHWYAEHLMWDGRFDEALRESERARQLDPLSLIIAADNGAILLFSRDYDHAIEKWRSVLEMDPDFSRAHLIRAAYTEKGMFAGALADTETTRRWTPTPGYWSWLAYIYGRSGQTTKANHAIAELLQANATHAVDPMLLAWAYVGSGNKNESLGWLETAYAHHSTELVSLKVNPGFDPLRSDSRFQSLLRRVGFAN